MNVGQAVFAFAGSLLLLSSVLVWLVSPWFLLIAVFIGGNLLQAAFTGFCPAAIAFRRFGLPAGGAYR
jgi:hypothetical protein